MAIAEVDVFDAKAKTFEEAQSAPIKEMGHETVVAFELGENGAGLGSRENDGQLGRAPDPLDSGNKLELPFEHLLIKEKKRAEGLILSRRGDMAVDGEMAQEGRDLFLAHIGWVLLVVEKDISPNPLHIELFGPEAVALDAEMPANAVEQAGGRWGSTHSPMMTVGKGFRQVCAYLLRRQGVLQDIQAEEQGVRIAIGYLGRENQAFAGAK